ncbi:IucA/IucC family protein [Paenibacillaceae bacterium WGS1546]|uniref:IucA/IucC family protein n=1 Tax=Cohnella sp. WGS1546 TaxID=3366810 RepID=UPI00372D84B7
MIRERTDEARTRTDWGGHAAEEAELRVLEDLVNALLAENVLDGQDRVKLVDPGEWRRLVREDEALAAADRLFGAPREAHVYRWRLSGVREAEIVFPVMPAIVQTYRFDATAGAYEIRGDGEREAPRRVGPVELMRHALALCGEDRETCDPESAGRFLHLLEQALGQLAWTLESEQPRGALLSLAAPESLLALERKAAYRDRPFHPISKVKLGLEEDDYRRYSAEFGRPIGLRWMAVSRRRIAAGEEGLAGPAELLLTEEERAGIGGEMKRRGLNPADYVPIPVHPWQMRKLPELLKEELAEGVCVPLETEAGVYFATSSLRSLMPASGDGPHLKLPVGVQSLGGLRYLSAIKLMNGGRAERLMRKGLERDPVLREKLFLCEETAWWAYLPENRDLFAEAPRHLSAMVRRYPAELAAADARARLVPMSALAVYDSAEGGHVFDDWLRGRGEAVTEASVVRLFGETLRTFFEIGLRLFRLGMMPEAHGQNAVLVVRDGEPAGALLRDHDALRVHVPWLVANGLADPEYSLRPNYPNSLYHDAPEKLLAFFQTLGIQVNGYAILDALSRYYGIPEVRLWPALREALERAAAGTGLPEEAKRIVDRCLFEPERWPWKQLIRPLLKPRSRAAGSMPFGMGEAPNPLRAHAASPSRAGV